MEIALKIAQLETKTLPELQKIWGDYFQEPTDSNNKEFFVSRIAYRIQELALGGLSTSTQKMISSLYVNPKLKKNLPPTGTRIVRIYHGIEHSIKIWNDGFEYNVNNVDILVLVITQKNN